MENSDVIKSSQVSFLVMLSLTWQSRGLNGLELDRLSRRRGVAYLFRTCIGGEKGEETLAPYLLGIAAYIRQRLKPLAGG